MLADAPLKLYYAGHRQFTCALTCVVELQRGVRRHPETPALHVVQQNSAKKNFQAPRPPAVPVRLGQASKRKCGQLPCLAIPGHRLAAADRLPPAARERMTAAARWADWLRTRSAGCPLAGATHQAAAPERPVTAARRQTGGELGVTTATGQEPLTRPLPRSDRSPRLDGQTGGELGVSAGRWPEPRTRPANWGRLTTGARWAD